MTWEELKKEIEHMTPEQRAENALFLTPEFETIVMKRLITDHGVPYMGDF